MKANTIQDTAANRSYTAIKAMIFQNQLVPNQKITYDLLAKKINVSKTPIVNALSRLEQEGFVMLIPNRGFFIKEIDIQEIKKLFKIRETLEMLSVEESMTYFDLDFLKEIEIAMLKHKEYDHSAPSRNRLVLDAIFHLKIAEMSRNKNLVRLLKHIFEHIYLRHRIEGVDPARLVKAANEHQDIYSALKDHKLSKAKQRMKAHIKLGQIANIQAILKCNQGLLL